MCLYYFYTCFCFIIIMTYFSLVSHFYFINDGWDLWSFFLCYSFCVIEPWDLNFWLRACFAQCIHFGLDSGRASTNLVLTCWSVDNKFLVVLHTSSRLFLLLYKLILDWLILASLFLVKSHLLLFSICSLCLLLSFHFYYILYSSMLRFDFINCRLILLSFIGDLDLDYWAPRLGSVIGTFNTNLTDKMFYR